MTAVWNVHRWAPHLEMLRKVGKGRITIQCKTSNTAWPKTPLYCLGRSWSSLESETCRSEGDLNWIESKIQDYPWKKLCEKKSCLTVWSASDLRERHCSCSSTAKFSSQQNPCIQLYRCRFCRTTSCQIIRLHSKRRWKGLDMFIYTLCGKSNPSWDCTGHGGTSIPKRFTAKRGFPIKVLSDNRLTFKAADRMLSSILNHPTVKAYFKGMKVQWDFNLKKAPWRGRIFERMVRSEVSAENDRKRTTHPWWASHCPHRSWDDCQLETTVFRIDWDTEEPITQSHLIVGHKLMSLPDGPYNEDLEDDFVEHSTLTNVWFNSTKFCNISGDVGRLSTWVSWGDRFERVEELRWASGHGTFSRTPTSRLLWYVAPVQLLVHLYHYWWCSVIPTMHLE